MNTLLLLLITLGPEAKRQLEIPSQLVRPMAKWADLNGDGILDIWVHDKNRSLWVWDGASTDTTLVRVPFEPIGLAVRPVWVHGNWRASAYERGFQYHYEPDQGWIIQTEYKTVGRVRPGLEPIQGQYGTLVPTFDGYQLLEKQTTCLLETFRTLPSIQLDNRNLTLRYPVPVWRHVDRDQKKDLIAAPIAFPQQGELGIWSALSSGDGWSGSWSRLLFPSNLEAEEHAFGDLNGDGFDELVVLTRPSQDMSVFEELSFMVYMGTDYGKWDPISVQNLKTMQNLWQVGPMEIDHRGIYLYYYKGIFRSSFKIDFYRWNEAGFLSPKPVTLKWSVKDADTDTIILDHDLNGDGLTDLILSGEKGVVAHYRKNPKGKLPFSAKPDRTILRRSSEDTVPGLKNVSVSTAISKTQLRREGSLALINNQEGKTPSLWTMYASEQGYWYLKEL